MNHAGMNPHSTQPQTPLPPQREQRPAERLAKRTAQQQRAYLSRSGPSATATSPSPQHALERSNTSALPGRDGAALYGMPGQIANALAQHTEAHPASLLLQLLTAFGNKVGYGPHCSVHLRVGPACSRRLPGIQFHRKQQLTSNA